MRRPLVPQRTATSESSVTSTRLLTPVTNGSPWLLTWKRTSRLTHGIQRMALMIRFCFENRKSWPAVPGRKFER